MNPTIEAGLRRHRAITLAALAGLCLLAWAWLLLGAGVAAPGAAMEGMAMAPPAWSPGHFALTFAMWWTMMAAMMLPAAAPMVLLYARAAARPGSPAPASGAFIAGYLLVWAAFSLLAAALQLWLDRAVLLAPQSMALTGHRLTGVLLIAAGLYQLSPAKGSCLRHCRNPTQFLSRHYRPGASGALRMGLIHGAWCLGCCWALMLLLFAGGVMNLAWIAALTLLVAAEKLLPAGRWISRLAGAACLGYGAVLLAQ
jgi:predicted metal-binding membrane protein